MDSSSKLEYRDSRRWIVMLAFSVLSFSTALGFMNLNGIPFCASVYYHNREISSILTIANSSNILFIVLGWLAIPLLKWRLDYSLIGGAVFSCAGFWMRYFAQKSFFTAFAGSVLNSISQITILPAYIYLPEVWFPMEERNLAFGVPFYFNLLGLNFGFMFPTQFVEVSENGECNIAMMQFVCAAISTVSLVISCLFIKNKPRSPPVKRHLQVARASHRKSLQTIFCNAFQLFDIVVLGMFVGACWSAISVIGIIFDEESLPYGGPYFSTTRIGLMVLSFSISGIVSGSVTSFVIMKSITNKVKPRIDLYMRVFLGIGFVGILGVSLLTILNVSIYFAYTVLLCVSGIGLIGYIPSACQSLVENLFPARELVTATIFFVSANLFSQIFSKIASLNDLENNGLTIIPSAMMLPLLYLIFCYETEFKRYTFNQKKSTTEKLEFQIISGDDIPKPHERLLSK